MESCKKLIWTEPAKNDLNEIYLFHVDKSVKAANKIIDSIIDKSNIILQKGFEMAGQIDDINPKYRRLIEGNYKILYTITENNIIINRIFDCRKDPVKLINSV